MMSLARPPRGLVIAPFSLVPLDQGGNVHVDAHIRQLKLLGHEIWYLGAGLSPDLAERMAGAWGSRFVNAPVLRHSFGHRFRRAFLRQLKLSPPLDAWFHPAWLQVAGKLEAQVHFDYVIAHYVFLTRFFAAFPPKVRKIIDTHDSFIDRRSRLAAQGVNNDWWYCSAGGQSKGLKRGDIVMANQADDAALFETQLKGRRKVIVVGHPVQWEPLTEASTPTIGFLASTTVQNQTCLAWFIEKIWPLILAGVPSAELLLAGSICEIPGPWRQTCGVRQLGRVADVREFHRLTRLEINPVFAGSGLKIKTMETLASGRALVSVSEGVAGLSRDFDAFVVADAPEAFAAAVVRLLQRPDERAALSAATGRLLAAWNSRQQAAMESLFDGLDLPRQVSDWKT